MFGAVLAFLAEWISTGRFPREEFQFSPTRVAIAVAVGFAALMAAGVIVGLAVSAASS